jgi:ABC-type multidrug transport system ATPase subunit
MMVGLVGVTGGDATVFGHSIRDSIDSVQSMLGLCPQFDILVRIFVETSTPLTDT